ncbi:tol protein [Dactylonectria estremocensis]|uniref:Tol protein n=1 Tax=Dactylonectria estremocensis TaxID=1079267 RepID=A0A9P9E1B4_9HYPO|nr:tol protein [Dactylonectria estremocensis]
MPFPRAQPRTSSRSTLDLALQWTMNCRESHPGCRQLQDKKIWCPTRLIDIGDEGGEAWKLVSLPGKLQSSPIYMTLSYRWGSSVKFRLLNGNLHAFQNWQPVRDLPLTFQDAISVARKFSVRFLWIDALCIIQDCREDWAREAKAMGRVYANALCNLAAVASSDPDGGLFRNRNPEELHPAIVRASLSSTEPPEHYYAVESKYTERQVFDSELLKRGWVFQERLLCSRVLYFAEKQVFWECFIEQRCEAFPYGIPHKTSSKERDLSTIIKFKKGTLADRKDFTWEVTSKWCELVETYAECELTKASDKPFAMEGIAGLFRHRFHDEYLFGLWKTNLVSQLSYSVSSPQPRSSSECIAPSWSWASLKASVRFPQLPWTATDYAQVLQIDMPQRTLRLSGHVFRATIDRKEGASLNHVDLIVDNSRTYARMYPDKLGCLILEPILVASVETYRRIGFLKVDRGQDLTFFGIKI